MYRNDVLGRCLIRVSIVMVNGVDVSELNCVPMIPRGIISKDICLQCS